ncbi:hypothetical protein CFBP4996_19675 [Agrobacterium leguminum]|uniref:DUF4393 domain-containing protein n=1 Tax=Agrobacterium deltaense NCPPB 1641 TaxID=1183425 RepID=A0A1S7TW46_9HYPH|nr:MULTISPECIES: hypothetical protein [Agrobacterium]WFS68236.1 hypothetical protein CFBP4996_19675 [Agrobacterium leguminum]CVI58794.1 conserved hypothetical protein [Agrobacterium deltaense NCPPB 1641]
MSGDKLPSYPNSDDRSFGYEVARTTIDAAASLVPGGGYAVGKLVERFVAAPLQKRRDEWFERVGAGLRDLEERLHGFDPASLEANEDFVSAVFEATQAAMKTSRHEKLEALRNGVLNIAAGQTIDELLRGSFFSYIDRFSPAHIRVLSLLSDPISSPEMREFAQNTYAGSQLSGLQKAIPSTVIDYAGLKRILAELDREGLADTGSMNAMGTSASLLAKRSTNDGDAFLRFVSDPFEK